MRIRRAAVKEKPNPFRQGGGSDELSVAEFPIGLLCPRAERSKDLRVEFQVADKRWVVEAHQDYGMPTDLDMDVYVALLELARQQGMPTVVEFDRRELVKRLDWEPRKKSYDRLELALRRLRRTTIMATNAFLRPDQKGFYDYIEVGIIHDWGILRGPHRLFVQWGERFYQNMARGKWKGLDLDLYASLSSGVTKRLYRFLDLRGVDGKPAFDIDMKLLAFEHLGLDRSYYPSQLTRLLQKPHGELIEVGYLEDAEHYQENRTHRIRYHYAPRPRRRKKNDDAQKVKQIALDMPCVASAWEEHWAALPAEERERIDAQARERLRLENPTVAAVAERRPESPTVEAALQQLRREVAGWR
jgi:hypothetical protein